LKLGRGLGIGFSVNDPLDEARAFRSVGGRIKNDLNLGFFARPDGFLQTSSGAVTRHAERPATRFPFAKEVGLRAHAGGINFGNILDGKGELQPYEIEMFLYNNNEDERRMNFTVMMLSNDYYDILRLNNFGDISAIPNIKEYVDFVMLRNGMRNKGIWVTDYPGPIVNTLSMGEKDIKIYQAMESPENSNETINKFREEQSNNLIERARVYSLLGFNHISFCCLYDPEVGETYMFGGMFDADGNERPVVGVYSHFVREVMDGVSN